MTLTSLSFPVYVSFIGDDWLAISSVLLVCTGTVCRLQRAYANALRLDCAGCFAMTELRHGSNVAALQTEAVLDVASDEWIVHTPDEGAIKWYGCPYSVGPRMHQAIFVDAHMILLSKHQPLRTGRICWQVCSMQDSAQYLPKTADIYRWIGNAAEDGRAATVFARLKIPAPEGGMKDHGVHALIVPLRDDGGNLLPGVDIRDCGYKVRYSCPRSHHSEGTPLRLTEFARASCKHVDSLVTEVYVAGMLYLVLSLLAVDLY